MSFRMMSDLISSRRWKIASSSYSERMKGIPPKWMYLRYSSNLSSVSSWIERNSLKDSGSILISMFRPVSSVDISVERRCAFEPVTYMSQSMSILSESTILSHPPIYWTSSSTM